MLPRPTRGSGNVVGVLHLPGPFLADEHPRREVQDESIGLLGSRTYAADRGCHLGIIPLEVLPGLLEFGLAMCGRSRSAIG